jgi:hypothetical protein
VNRKLKLGLVWAVPFGLFLVYALIDLMLNHYVPNLKGLPSFRTLEGTAALEILASPLWVGLAIATEYVFGGSVLVYFITLLSKRRLTNRKFVLSARKDTIERIASEKQAIGVTIDTFSFQSFAKALGLAMGLNLAYTLFLERYYSSILRGPAIKFVGNYFLLPQFILVEFGIAIVFLPLIEIVMPLVLGRLRIRLVDGFPIEYLWLGYVYSAAGGVSLLLLFLNLIDGKTGSRTFVLASLFVYVLISWYTALGSVLGRAFAEKKLAQRLNALKGVRNIYYGSIFVGRNREEAEEV